MREILFRAKRTDNGKWVYGSLLIQTGERINKDELTPDEYRILGCRGENYLVNPKTVGQYTGLRDKNGTRIFEGDIIWDITFDPEMKENHIVMFDEGGFCTVEMFLQSYLCFDEMEVEVIGNIHDNPEMIERGAENE